MSSEEISTQFTPFDDTQAILRVVTSADTGGIDTREIDAYRQGAEIKTNRHRFAGMQPKIWAGNLDHVVNTTTLGQARSFVEFENSLLFEDLPEFSAVSYITLGPNYPLPIVFNEGPQQEEEASMEPLTIPFRKPSIENSFHAHRTAGSVEDGNNFDTSFGNTNKILQFQEYDDARDIRYFLDEGAGNWGSVTNGITIPGYTQGQERSHHPFDDTTIDDIPQSLTDATDMELVLIQMKMNLDDDFREPYSRSGNANTFVYGGDSAKYGTDSFAYIGTARG